MAAFAQDPRHGKELAPSFPAALLPWIKAEPVSSIPISLMLSLYITTHRMQTAEDLQHTKALRGYFLLWESVYCKDFETHYTIRGNKDAPLHVAMGTGI